MQLDKDIEKLEQKIQHNASKIESNAQQIYQNTGALEVLHTIKVFTIRFFVMWIITFVAFLVSVGYIVYLVSDTTTVITDTEQQVEQDNTEGSNYYIGRDGEING